MIPHLLHPAGTVDAAAAGRLLASMTEDRTYTLDFEDVDGIHFAALRKLMNARRAGCRFCIINACDAVVDRFVDSGVGTLIDVCRKPKPLDLSRYEEFGASYMSKAYNCDDGDSMMKLYGPGVPRETVFREKTVARAVMLFGLPTPLVGSVSEDGGRTALDFERIHGKRSFSRIISEEPGKLEAIARRFARMSRQLHETPCDTAVFENSVLAHRQAVINCRELTDADKEAFLSFADSIPAATTCLHGDLHIGNIITDGQRDLWIDVGDFAYGVPEWDLGMMYFASNFMSEERCDNIFHLNNATLRAHWNAFARVYYDTDSKEALEAEVRKMHPFIATKILFASTKVSGVKGPVTEGLLQIIDKFLPK